MLQFLLLDDHKLAQDVRTRRDCCICIFTDLGMHRAQRRWLCVCHHVRGPTWKQGNQVCPPGVLCGFCMEPGFLMAPRKCIPANSMEACHLLGPSFSGGVVVKNPPAKAGDTRGAGSVPGSERSPGVENRTPLQYFCLDNSMGKGAWWATVHGATKSWTQLSTHTNGKL